MLKIGTSEDFNSYCIIIKDKFIMVFTQKLYRKVAFCQYKK